MPAAIDAQAVAASTRQSSSTACHTFKLAGIRALRAFTPSQPRETPATPPDNPSTTLSASICRISAARPLPSASRVAISRVRPAARASSSPAMFTQPISNTNPTAAQRIRSGWRTYSVKPRWNEINCKRVEGSCPY